MDLRFACAAIFLNNATTVPKRERLQTEVQYDQCTTKAGTCGGMLARPASYNDASIWLLIR